jgi:hypothetical protein
MSIYRKYDAMRLPSNDVYASSRHSSKSLAERPSAPIPDATQRQDRKRGRKAAPANVPLPRTLAWVESLPPSVKPAALLRQYARIANVLAAAWDDPKATSSYMNCLFRDDRGDRRGFPPDVLRELMALREYHTTFDAEKLST